jgi:putative membrane protein
MFLEIILYLFIGILLGIIAGLIPGIHPNTFAFLILAFSPFLGLEIIYLIAILIGAEITNSFIDFIPSILFFAPEEDTALSILPSQKFLLQGKAYEAIYLTVYGGLFSALFIIAFFPLFIILIPIFYNYLKPLIALLLILTILHLFYTQKKNKFSAFLVFLFSSILGLLIFQLPLSSISALFPTFAGLFGLSSLFFASFKSEIPEQEIDSDLENCSKKKSSLLAVFSGLLSGILPGVGSSQVTVMSQQLAGMKKNLKDFMLMIGGITTSNSIFSIIALFTIGNPRSGASAAIQALNFEISLNNLFLILFLISIAVGIAAILTLKFSKILIRNLYKVKYNKLTKLIFSLLLVLIFGTTGWIGLVIALTSFAIGIFCITQGVRRSFMMSVLIIPTILIFLRI